MSAPAASKVADRWPDAVPNQIRAAFYGQKNRTDIDALRQLGRRYESMIKIHAPTSNDPRPSLSPSSSWCSQRSNPKYTGRQVWGRRHHGRRAPRTHWAWSGVWAHPPLITVEEFAAANRRSWLVAAPPSDNDAEQPPEQGRAA